MCRAPMKPLVAIVGATGTGKSDLAVELAHYFNGEIINGDAMQLYHGLPVITNKIPKDEMRGVPHHLLGCIELAEETWTVGKFVKNALGVIDEIRSRGKLPILVGGTHYYTQSLLFQDQLVDKSMLEVNGNTETLKILDKPTEVILEKLKEVDPVIAERWHPNERRKIQRSLEIYLRTGKRASQIYDEQRTEREISLNEDDAETTQNGANGSSLRFPTLLFWIHAPKDILCQRLDARIIKMLDRGLLSEVETLTNFRTTYETRTGKVVDQGRGIWVSIGYKEFLEYHSALNEPSSNDKDLQKLKAAAIEKTQAATRQYAKRQLRWIRTKLLNAVLKAGLKNNVFLLDGSDLPKWEDSVLEPARSITSQFLSGTSLPEPTGLSDLAAEMLTPKRDYDLGQRPDLWQKRVCEMCGTVTVNENDWNLHIKSRTHRRAVGRKKKAGNVPKRETKDIKAARVDFVEVQDTYLGLKEKEEDENER
ncbi:tRNA isopentenyltransferase [Lojkania enalia]|uniref:tRNA dimethylallyltransferase n=1 Tax=Lojkania enalia TaxID=147567 RepID=A0A9P4TQS6_9PLEO|nr:tRNA isopentenyltransferase [Didymosphaeria enalia]